MKLAKYVKNKELICDLILILVLNSSIIYLFLRGL